MFKKILLVIALLLTTNIYVLAQESHFGVDWTKDADTRELFGSIKKVGALGPINLRHLWHDVKRLTVDEQQEGLVEGRYFLPITDAYLEQAHEYGLSIVLVLFGDYHNANKPVTYYKYGWDDATDEQIMHYAKAILERYDGDLDFGVPEIDNSYPNCDYNDDGIMTIDEKKRWAEAHTINAYDVMNEPANLYNSYQSWVEGGTDRRTGVKRIPRDPKGYLTAGNDIIPADMIVKYMKPEEYAKFVRIAKISANLVADNDPKILISPVGAGRPEEWWDVVYEKSGDYFDVNGYHPYGRWETVEQTTERIKTNMKKHGLEKELWATETGASQGFNYLDGSFGLDSEIEQAKDIIKRFSILFGAGVTKAFWHKVMDNMPSTPHQRNWSTYGIYHLGEKPKVIFYTYRNYIKEMDYFENVRKIRKHVYEYNFDNGVKKIVAWTERGKTDTINAEELLGQPNVLISDLIVLGDEKVEKKSVPAYSIEITDSPILIERPSTY